jgi:regulator of nucleoside diphosphate kinase
MENTQSLILKKSDYERILSLLNVTRNEIADQLEEELARAKLVEDSDLPKDVVAMNSTVLFEDLDTGKDFTVTLVYPHEAKLEENKISILAPIGAALIGLRVNQQIDWPLPSGKSRHLKVTSVKNP